MFWISHKQGRSQKNSIEDWPLCVSNVKERQLFSMFIIHKDLSHLVILTVKFIDCV